MFGSLRGVVMSCEQRAVSRAASSEQRDQPGRTDRQPVAITPITPELPNAVWHFFALLHVVPEPARCWYAPRPAHSCLTYSIDIHPPIHPFILSSLFILALSSASSCLCCAPSRPPA